MAREVRQVATDARTFSGSAELGYRLLEVAAAEMGPDAAPDGIEARASRLLLTSMGKVGLNPATEMRQRQRLCRVLRGEHASRQELQDSVNSVLGEVVEKAKGVIAECLAIKPCLERLRRLQEEGRLPGGHSSGRTSGNRSFPTVPTAVPNSRAGSRGLTASSALRSIPPSGLASGAKADLPFLAREGFWFSGQPRLSPTRA